MCLRLYRFVPLRCGLKSRPSRMACALICGIAMLLGLSTLLRANTDTWNGGGTDTNWMTAGNWNTLPQPNDILVFDGTAGLTNNNNFTAGTQFNGITFNSTAGLFVLNGNSVLLGGDINDNSTTNLEKINLGLIYNGGTENINVAAGGSLALGAVTLGSTAGSTTVSTLNINSSLSATALTAQTNSASANIINLGSSKLTLSGAMVVGFATSITSPTPNTTLNITGNELDLNNSLTVGLAESGATTRTNNTLDLSQLNVFQMIATGSGQAFNAATNTQANGTVNLAKVSNLINTLTINVGSTTSNAGTGTLNLGGGTNVLEAGTFNVGTGKATGVIQFAGSTGSITIAGTNGTGTAPGMNFGRDTSGTSSNGISSMNVAGHLANITAGTITLGSEAGNTGQTPKGNITFDTGTFNVSSLQMAIDSSGSSTGGSKGAFYLGGTSYNPTATGVLTTTASTGSLVLANNTNATASGLTEGAFVVNGGTGNIGSDITVGGTQGTRTTSLVLVGGTLNMQGHAIGSAAAPVTNIGLTLPGDTATLSNLGGAGINGAGLTLASSTFTLPATLATAPGSVAYGGGTLILSGNNTYTGGTTVSSGTLRVTGTVSGSGATVGTNVGTAILQLNGGGAITGGDTTVTSGGIATGTGNYGNVNVSGGTFTAGTPTAIGTVGAANVTVNSGNVTFKFSGSSADRINLTGTSNLSNSQVAINQLTPVTSASYLVLTSAGPLSGITLDNSHPTTNLVTLGRTSYGIDNAAFTSNPNQLTIDVTGAPATLKWTGADATNPTNWDNSQTAANWSRTDGGTSDPTHFYDADNVVFDGTNSGASISISGTVTPGSMAVTAGTYTIGGGQIAGSGALTISGTGNLTLTGFNTMTGPVNVNGGTLNDNTSQALGLGPITIGGGVLNLNATFALANNVISLNSGTLNLADPLGTALGTGLLTINGGTLDNTSGGAVTLANNPPMSISGSFAFAGAADGTHDLNMGTGAVALTASPTITVATGTLTIEGIISGAGKGLTKAGAGTLILDNSVLPAANSDNNYSGGATVNAGILEVKRKTSGRTPLGSGNTTVNAGGTLIGANSDAFGFTNGASPATIFIHGGTVTDLANTSFRITLQDINFTGGTLTSDPTNFGANDSGNVAVSNYSLNAGTVETNAATSTAVISAGIVSLQHGAITFTVAPGTVAGGPTPGVDLLVSSPLIEWHPSGTTTTTGSINKTGGGVMLLTGNSTYTGATTVTGGTLRLASTTVNNNIPNSAAINVNSGATLDVSGVTAVSTTTGFTLASGQTLANNGTVVGSVDAGPSSTATGSGIYGPIVLDGGILTPNSATSIGTVGASTLTVNSGSLQLKFSGATADAINLSGATNLTNSGISIKQLSLPTPGSYLVLTSGGNLTGITAGALNTDTGRIIYTIDGPALTAHPNQITIDVTGGPATVKWTGADNSHNPAQWNNARTDANWQRTDGGTNDPTHFYDLDNVLFDGTNTGPSNLTVSGPVAPGSITVSAGTYTFGGTGSIANGGALVVSGSGNLTLGVNYSATSNTTITGGTLQVGAGGAAGSLGTGGVTDNGTLIFNRSDSLAVPNVIGGSGGLQQIGSGTITLSGVNSYSGPTTITAGSIVVTNSNSLGAVPGGSVTVANGATLDISVLTGAANLLNFGQKQFFIAGNGFDGQGAIVNRATAVAQQNVFQQVALTADASIGGPTRFDIRSVAVGGVNQSKLDLAGHTLTDNNTNFIGIVGTDVTDGNIVVNSGTLDFETTTNVANNNSGTSLTFNSGSTAFFFNYTGTLTRPINLNQGSTIGNDTNNTAVVGSNITLGGAGAGTITVAALNTNGTGTLTLNGNIGETGGPQSITKNNNGTGVSTLILGGNNTFTGGLIINGGVVQLNNAGALNSTTPNVVAFGSGATATTVLHLNGNSVTVSGLSAGSALPAVDDSGATSATLTVNNSADYVYDATLQNGTGGTLALTKSGAGNLTLGGANTYTGATTVTGGTLIAGDPTQGTGSFTSTIYNVQGGTLRVARGAALPAAANITLGNGPSSGVLDLDGQSITVAGLSTSGAGSANIVGNSGSSPSTLTFAGGSTSFGGIIQDALGSGTSTTALTVSGGSLTLAGASTHTGGTNVNAGGTLIVNGSLNATAPVALSGTLSGAGSVGNVTTSSGSSIRPGLSAANSTIGNLSMSSLTDNGGDYRIDVASGNQSDLVTVAGTANFASPSTLTATTTVPGTYTILTAGTLTGTAPTYSIPAGTTRATYTIHFGDLVPNQIQLVIVGAPETITWTGTDVNDGTAWDVAGHFNWTDGSPTQFFNQDSVVFGDGPANRNIVLGGATAIQPNAVTVNNSLGNDYSFGGGSIADSGFASGTTLTKMGTGALTINNANTYSGGTFVQNGTLSANAAGALGVGPLTATGGITNLNVAGALGSSTAAINVNGGTVNLAVDNASGSNPINLTSGNLNVATAASTGSSVLTFNGTTPTGGTLDNTSTGLLTLVSTTHFVLAGNFTYGGATQSLNTGTGAVSLSANSIINVAANTLTIGGIISDINGNSLTKTGNGTLVLSGVNTYTGPTIISGGALVVTNTSATASSLGANAASSGLVTINGGTLDLSSLTPANTTGFTNRSFVISGTGVGGEGAIFSNNTLAQQNAFRKITLAADATIGGSGATYNAQGGSFAIGRYDLRGATFPAQNTLDLAGHTLTKEGNSQFTLVNTSVTAGNIVLTSPGPFGSGTPATLGIETTSSVLAATNPDNTPSTITFNDNTNLEVFQTSLNGGSVTRQMIMNGTVLVTNGTNTALSTVASPITINGTLRVDTSVSNVNGPTTLTGNISGPGSIVKANDAATAILTLTGNNTYMGGTTVSGGTLATTGTGVIGPGALSISPSATGSAILSVGNSQSVQSLTVNAAATATARVDVAPGDTLRVTGPSSVQGTLTLNQGTGSTGTLAINGSSSLATGSGLAIQAGTMQFNASGSSSVGTGVTATVASGATLELDGTTSALTDATTTTNRVNVANSGNLKVGNTAVTPTTVQQVGAIDGTGSTNVADGSQLTANHIIQGALVIGSTGASPSLVTIAASDANGNSLGTSGGLAVAGSLAPSDPFGAASGSGASQLGGDDPAAVGALSAGAGVAAGGSAAVPEPATFVLMALAAVAGLLIRLRR